MSVSFVAHVAQRIWRGYDDPGLPVGMYWAQGAVTGDASGGNATVTFEFRGEGAAASARFYNIEQIEAHHSSTTTRDIFLAANNWDRVGDVGLVIKNWASRVIANSNNVAAMRIDTQFPVPIFLGATSPVASLSADISIGIDNIDLSSFVVTIQGYIWEPRSVMALGGLRRPLDSLYGGGR